MQIKIFSAQLDSAPGLGNDPAGGREKAIDNLETDVNEFLKGVPHSQLVQVSWYQTSASGDSRGFTHLTAVITYQK